MVISATRRETTSRRIITVMIPIQMMKQLAEQHVADLQRQVGRGSGRVMPVRRRFRARPAGSRHQRAARAWWRLEVQPGLGAARDPA